MKLGWVHVASLGVMALSGAARAADGEVGNGTFEALVAAASGSVDLASVVEPFVESCSDARRELDRARCRATTGYLKQALPGRSYVFVSSDPDVVAVSGYDARLKGYRLIVSGCLACKEPIAVSGGKRFVTLREPAGEADSLTKSAEIARATLAFDGVAAAQAWAKDVKPRLRAEFVFTPEPREWTSDGGRGFAFKLLGARVFDHCTGEVVWSKPPSAGPAEKMQDAGECEVARDATPSSGRDTSGLPDELSSTAINEAIGRARDAMEACLAKFGTRATALVAFAVPGDTGVPSSVTIQGPLGGTEPGTCVVEAARKVTFPKFAKREQRFTYPVRLRR
jgi:hypothetical protein